MRVASARVALVLVAAAVAAAARAAAAATAETFCVFKDSESGAHFDVSSLADLSLGAAQQHNGVLVLEDSSYSGWVGVSPCGSASMRSATGSCSGPPGVHDAMGLWMQRDPQSAGGTFCDQSPQISSVLGFAREAPSFQLVSAENPDRGFSATYTGASTCNRQQAGGTYVVSLMFLCDRKVTTPTVTLHPSSGNVCGYNVEITTSSACPSYPGSAGLGAGSVLLIIMLVLFTAYCVVGIAYKKMALGTSGLESVPNIDFWRLFPTHVANGCRWTWQKLTCQTVHDYQPANMSEDLMENPADTL